MKNLKIGINLSLLFSLTLLLICCGENKTAPKTAQPEKKIEYIYSDSDDCNEQLEGITKSKNVRLLFFDSKGMFDEDAYQQSPSARIKKQIKNDADFQNLAKKHFDFISVSQDCEIGQQLSLKFGIQMFPVFILQDEKGVGLYKHSPMLSINKMKGELKERFKQD